MEPGTLAKVLNDFFTTVDGELSLRKGDYFLIHRMIDKHWCYGEAQSKIGKFPINHLHKIELPKIQDFEKLFISIAAFRGEQEKDLSFEQGEIVIGIQEVGAGWYYGYSIHGTEGIFPITHVWQPNPEVLKTIPVAKVICKKARVTTNLKAQLDGELDLTAGEIVTVLEMLEDGWCRGIKEDGTEGTFPEGFITYISNEIDEFDSASATTYDTTTFTNRSSRELLSSQASDQEYNLNDAAPNYYDLFPEYAMPASDNPEKVMIDTDSKPYAITLYPFDAEFPNELSFEAGEIVYLIKYADSEWLEGTKDNAKGIFPVSYVNIIVDCTDNKESLVTDDLATLDNDDRVAKPSEEGKYINISEIDPNMQSMENKNDIMAENTDAIDQPDKSDTSFDDFVIVRASEVQPEDTKKRLAPHRPAPPAPALLEHCAQKKLVENAASSLNDLSKDCENAISRSTRAKMKQMDQRQNVISELVLTEKEYIRDLKLTTEVFNLHNPKFLEGKGIDVPVLFGNIFDVIVVAEELLDMMQRSMKGQDEEVQMIGPCFVKMAEELQTVYVKYCRNHEDALALLQKYETNEDILTVFNKGIETLRCQIACFDMSSILIKPVQRILKYPLILRELEKFTEDNHPDRSAVEQAYLTMTRVANYINESKRRKDLVSKYLDSENTLRRRIANLSMHSVAKISTRLSTKLSASLGLTNLVQDSEFEELERQFRLVEKCVWQLAKDVEQCVAFVSTEALYGEVISSFLMQYYQGVPNTEVQNLQDLRSTIRSLYLQDLKSCLERRVNVPLHALATLLEGPATLITKRYDKMLDYDAAISRSEKYKESRIVQEELATAKNNFEAMSQQLLEELPVLIDASTRILTQCVSAFAYARKFLCGKITKSYLNVCESSSQLSSQDILESFLVNHNLLWNQITRFSFANSNAASEQEQGVSCSQTKIQIAGLKNKYQTDKLYVALESVANTSPLDIGVAKGTVVAVLKQQDPLGDTSRWFVDTGVVKGFLPATILCPLHAKEQVDQTLEAINQPAVPDLISMNSPEKERTTASHLDELLTLDIDAESKKDNNCESAAKPQQYSAGNEFYYALFDFHVNMPGALSVSQGQVVRLIRPHDEKGNSDWWYVENREYFKGYVPHNYLKQLPPDKR